jgi:hypothetical protein
LGPDVGADWKRVLEQGWKSTEFELRLREATRAGRPIGDETFLCGAEQQVGHSLRPLKRGRKPRLWRICLCVACPRFSPRFSPQRLHRARPQGMLREAGRLRTNAGLSGPRGLAERCLLVDNRLLAPRL